MNLIRIAGAVVVAIMATFIALMLRRDKKAKQLIGETGHVA